MLHLLPGACAAVAFCSHWSTASSQACHPLLPPSVQTSRELLARWQVHFHFRLAEHALTHDSAEAAAEALAKLDSAAPSGEAATAGAGPKGEQHQQRGDGVQLTGLERVLHLLARATLHLWIGNHAAASAAIDAVNPLIEPAANGNKLLGAQLHAHYSLLLVAMVVQAGRISGLQQGELGGAEWYGGGKRWAALSMPACPCLTCGACLPRFSAAIPRLHRCKHSCILLPCPAADPSGNIQPLVKLQQLLTEMAGQPWAYSWLPQPALSAIGNLLHASLLRRWAGWVKRGEPSSKT